MLLGAKHGHHDAARVGTPMNYDDFSVGHKGQFTKRVTEVDNLLFAKLSGDYSPIHFEDSVGQLGGFRGKISNGFVTESRIAGALVATFGTGGTVVLAMEKNTRFLKPVYMDDDITATVEVVARIKPLQAIRIKAACFNQQNGDQVVATRMVIRLLPRPTEP